MEPFVLIFLEIFGVWKKYVQSFRLAFTVNNLATITLIEVNDAVKLLSELGMAFLFLLAGYEIDPKRLAGHQGKVGLVTWIHEMARLASPASVENPTKGATTRLAGME